MAGFGETLHQARAHMGVTLKEAEQATRINRHHLAALEEENFTALPPLIYQRGIIRNYATYLQLEPSKLLVMFEEAHGSGGKMPAASVAAVPPINMPAHWAPNFAIIAFAVVLSAIVFAWVYSAFVAQPDVELTPTAAVPTATPFENDIPVPTNPPTEAPATVVETEAPTPTQPASSGSRESTDVDGQSDQQRGGDNVRNANDQEAGETPVSEETQVIQSATTEETPDQQSAMDDSELTSIQITANDAIYVTVTVDGAVVFDGNLAAGETTGYITGNTFEVNTSWGEMTSFTDACGSEFLMGYESGDATYNLSWDENSCAPID
jgi:cytoskeletal protein RodZ